MIFLFFSLITFFDFCFFSFIGLAVRDVMSNKLVRVSDLTVTEKFKPNSDLLSFDVSVFDSFWSWLCDWFAFMAVYAILKTV
ncbi:unnamed protein product [Brassica rapa subsp. trilocularis]